MSRILALLGALIGALIGSTLALSIFFWVEGTLR